MRTLPRVSGFDEGLCRATQLRLSVDWRHLALFRHAAAPSRPSAACRERGVSACVRSVACHLTVCYCVFLFSFSSGSFLFSFILVRTLFFLFVSNLFVVCEPVLSSLRRQAFSAQLSLTFYEVDLSRVPSGISFV